MRKENERKRQKQLLVNGLEKNQDFLLRRFSQEWERIQKKEEKEKKLEKIEHAAKTTLKILAVGGVMTAALAAPGIFVLFDKAERRLFLPKKDFNAMRRSFLRKKYITVTQPSDTGAIRFSLTKKGKERALWYVYDSLRIPETETWDGIWRVVIFDIPERKKDERDGFRRSMKDIGFFQLQKSVFVTPYPCEEEIQFLISAFFIEAYVHFFVTQAIQPDDTLREYFGMEG